MFACREGVKLFLETLLAVLCLLPCCFSSTRASFYCADDDLVGVVVGEKAPDEGGGVGVFLDATLLELVELLARLPIEILPVHDEETLLDVGIVLQQR